MPNLRGVDLVLAVILAVVVAATVTPPAQAARGSIDNVVRGGCSLGGALETNSHTVCLTDNKKVYFWMEKSIDWSTAIDTKVEKSIFDTINRSYAGTDLEVFYDGDPVFKGAGETDIVYRARPQDFNDPKQNVVGYMWCDNRTTSLQRCDQAYINFQSKNASRALACHETGHAVGLTHGKDARTKGIENDDGRLGCMVTPLDNDKYRLEGSNVANINDVY